MKKTLSILLAVVLCFAMFTTFAGAEEAATNVLAAFSDAPEVGNWKHEGLASAVENSIMKGDNGEIRPDDNLTRAELTAMMVRVLGAQNDKADIAHLIDVAIDAWYADYIKSGVATKIITGAGNKMMPNDPVTREQAFTILARTFVLVADSHNAVSNFSDVNKVSDWAMDAAAALVERNVVLGGSSNDLRPKDNVTRAEYAAMLDRIVGEYAKPGKSYEGVTIKGTIVVTDPSVDLTGAIIEGDVIIADSLGGKEIAIKDATVGGDLVLRAGSVTVSGGTSVSNVVYGNPVHEASVKAEDGVKADKVVVTENATEVKNEISADKVEVSSSDANITLGGSTEYKDVAIEGNNTEVKVDEGTKVENVVANGSSNTVSGSGSVDNAVVNGEGTKVETPNTNVTDNTPVAPPASDTPAVDTPDEDKPSSDKPVNGGAQSGAGDSQNNAQVPSGGGTTVKKPEIVSSYITYNGGEKIFAEIEEGNVVKFDFRGYDLFEVELENIYLEAVNVSALTKAVHSLAEFELNNEIAIAPIIAAIPEKTNNALVPIDDAKKEDLRLIGLSYFVDYAKSMYDLTSDIDGSLLFQDLFTAKGITIEDEGENAVKSSFTGKIGNETFTFVIITELYLQ